MSSLEERLRSHTERVTQLGRERAALSAQETRLSLLRLALFLAAAAAITTAVSRGVPLAWLVGAGLGLGFFGAVVWHARVLAKRHEVDVRIAIHERHLKRIRGEQLATAKDGRNHLPAEHPYASDIDLVGAGSLFQRIDVSQTAEGETALAQALSAPATLEVIHARQAAVLELSGKPTFREEFEVRGAVHQRRNEKLDHRPFMALLEMPRVFATRPWLKPLAFVLLSATTASFVLSQLGMLDGRVFWACLFAQGVLLYRLSGPVHATLDLITARLGFAQAYEHMLRLLEEERWQAPYLRDLRAGLDVKGLSPSAHMARLARYEGYGQLRTQGPVYLVVNVLTLWDLFVLERIERFVDDVGPASERWFKAIGEVELLSSFATLHHVDPDASFPALVSKEQGLVAEGLVHPLIPVGSRIANDLPKLSPSAALVVTGSNMAGKSTLLRALGLNVALALAGGPVCARRFALPLVRLRASMRIEDSLQRGASYFHAELTRLRMVVGELDREPPVLFLLDELLRGTNARARHQGARAVILHLLSRGAMGLVATHDVALSELERERPGQVGNVHFTDVFEHGEMKFDFKLRDGVVRTSNALRLLAMAGVEVQVDDIVG
ncbi:MAG: hypothetical protein QM778_37280 [Myxococcales bacterium]